MNANRLFSLVFSGTLTCGLLACVLLLPGEATAGAVYRCNGANGQIAFTNKPTGYSGCTKVSNYADAPPAKAATSTRHTEYVTEPGEAAEKADAVAAVPAVEKDNEKNIEIHRGAVYKVT